MLFGQVCSGFVFLFAFSQFLFYNKEAGCVKCKHRNCLWIWIMNREGPGGSLQAENLSQGLRFDLWPLTWSCHSTDRPYFIFCISFNNSRCTGLFFFPLWCLPVQFSHPHPHILTSSEHVSSNKSNVIITFTSLHNKVNGQVCLQAIFWNASDIGQRNSLGH